MLDHRVSTLEKALKPKAIPVYKPFEGVNFLRQEETDENVDKLKVFLSSMSSADRKSICELYNGSTTLSGNLASLALPKIRFLNCILEVEPELLLQERLFVHPNQFLTVLHIAIRSKTPALVNAVLTHPLFVAERTNNVEADCSRLVRSYMWALRWYYEARNENTVVLRETISSILLGSCKESMREALLQQKAGLPDKLWQMCMMDGVCGEGYWQHKFGDELNAIHQNALKEVCAAY